MMSGSITQGLSRRRGVPPSLTVPRKVLALLACLGVVWFWVFVAAPLLATMPWVRPLHRYVAESGIDASALYYTEVEQTAEAEMYLNDARHYDPQGSGRR